MNHALQDIFLSLVRIPSPTGQEAQLADHLEGLLEELGLRVERVGDNLIGKRGEGSPRLLLNTHLDTVPGHVEPRVEDNRIYGRGAVDAKAGIASILQALRETRGSRVPLVVALVVDEEVGHTGIEEVLPLLEADMGVVMEPTGLEIVTGHKGRVVLEVEARGRSGHASEPWKLTNPIEDMARIISDLQVELLEHPALGPETMSFTTIRGGDASNVVPERCIAEVDYRYVPPNTPREIRYQVNQAINNVDLEGQVSVTLKKMGSGFTRPLLVEDRELIGLMKRAVQKAGIKPRTGLLHACTDAAYLSLGIPSVVFGPGEIEHAHTPDEYVDIGEVRRASQVLVHLIRFLD